MDAADPSQVLDDERVARRVPPTSPWFEPPDRVSSANFGLDTRTGELGVSVYRLSVVDAADVLGRPEAVAGSLLVVARVGDIRNLRDGAGNQLRLDVIASDDGGRNPGHAEIRGPAPGRMPKSAMRALQRLFRLSGDSRPA